MFGGDRPVTAREAGWFDDDTIIGGHNSYMVMALYGGIPGVLMFLLLMLVFLRSSWLLYRRAQSDQQRSFGLACHLMMVGLAIMGIGVDWVSDQVVVSIAILSGVYCTAAVARLPARRRAPSPAMPASSVTA